LSAYELPRRDFLLQALAACGTPLLLPFGAGATRQAAQDFRRGTDTASRYFGSTGAESARAIGEAYARQINLDSTEESILKAAGDVVRLIARSPGFEAAITALVRAVRRDFQEGRTVDVDGWVLARTEVELCLLMLLAPG
jgi:hypothetical protein